MLARLWWKDMRQFWPIWAVLIAAAAWCEWLVLKLVGDPARTGFLATGAVGLAAVYANVAGAAAFAGEREQGTLDLLDALPVSRGLLWRGKATFAALSTVGLLIVLLGLAALGTTRWDIPRIGLPAVVFGCLALTIESMGWALFWSSRTRTALSAALLAIVCLGVAAPLLTIPVAWLLPRLRIGPPFDEAGFVPVSIVRLVLAVLTLAASARAVIGQPRSSPGAGETGLRLGRLRLRSPLVIGGGAGEEIDPRVSDVDVETEPTTAPSPRRSLRKPFWPEFSALAWQTIREGRSRWIKLFAVGIGLPSLPVLLGFQLAPELVLSLLVLISLIAGVSTFQTETRDDAQRFLVQHGSLPRRVWLARVSIWSLAIVFLWATVFVLLASQVARLSGPIHLDSVLILLPFVIIAFGLGLPCGMAFRRGITAVVMAGVILVLLVIPTAGLTAQYMVDPPTLLTLPVAFAAVSWFWRSDWMYDRPAPGRWLRLAALTVLALGLVGGGYVAARVWSVPSIAPIAPPRPGTIDVAEADNAAPLYRAISRRLSRLGLAAARPNGILGLDWNDPQARSFLEANREQLDAIRAAAARPRCRFARSEPASVFTPSETAVTIPELADLVWLDASERINKDDLPGAWADIRTLFRLSRHLTDGAGIGPKTLAHPWEERAIRLTYSFANATGQTAAGLKSALRDLAALPERQRPDDAFEAEGRLLERTFDLPADDLRLKLLAMSQPGGSRGAANPERSAQDELAILPWERARAQRVLRLILADAVDQARREPWARDHFDPITRRYVTGVSRPPLNPAQVGPLDALGGSTTMMLPWRPDLVDLQRKTPLMRLLLPAFGAYLTNDALLETDARALVVYLRLRVWQLEHAGRLPDSLEALNDGTDTPLPTDPFTGLAFRYRRLSSPEVILLRRKLAGQGTTMIPDEGSLGDRQILYSVGPDRVDNRAQITYPDTQGRGDIWRLLPPEPPPQRR